MAKSGSLGQILVDGAGRSLYLFEKDKGSTSNCSGDCAKVWPPFTSSGPATAGTGAMSSLLGTTSRTDLSTQVTYHGHPLYYYVSDGSKAGSTAGQGLNQFGAGWYVLSPAGSKVDNRPVACERPRRWAGPLAVNRSQPSCSSKIRLPQLALPSPLFGMYCVASHTLLVPTMICPLE